MRLDQWADCQLKLSWMFRYLLYPEIPGMVLYSAILLVIYCMSYITRPQFFFRIENNPGILGMRKDPIERECLCNLSDISINIEEILKKGVACCSKSKFSHRLQYNDLLVKGSRII
jgi:hypothetical protein